MSYKSLHINGFYAGYVVIVYEPFLAGTGVHFRMYRNGVPTKCHFYITDQDNITLPDGFNGAVRARIFNTNPANQYPRESQNAYPIKAGELISHVIEPMDLVGYTMGEFYKYEIIPYLVLDIPDNATFIAQRLAAGTSGASGGEGGSGEEQGEIGA